MKPANTFALLLALSLESCERDESKAVSADQREVVSRSPLDPPDHWQQLEQKLEDLLTAYPGRPILLSISAKWSTTSTLAWRVLFSDEVTEMLTSAGWVCVVADVTEGDVAGNQAMNSLDRAAVPVTAIFDPVEKEWQVQNEVFAVEDVKNWVISIEVKIANARSPGPTAH